MTTASTSGDAADVRLPLGAARVVGEKGLSGGKGESVAEGSVGSRRRDV